MWAMRPTLRVLRFGTGTLILETLPGIIGGRFAAVVETGKPLPENAQVHARLVCVNRVKDLRSEEEFNIWEAETLVGPERTLSAVRGTRIPLNFEIPDHCPPTNDQDPLSRILWRLEMRTEDLTYVSSFEVPVFRIAASPGPASPHTQSASPRSP